MNSQDIINFMQQEMCDESLTQLLTEFIYQNVLCGSCKHQQVLVQFLEHVEL